MRGAAVLLLLAGALPSALAAFVPYAGAPLDEGPSVFFAERALENATLAVRTILAGEDAALAHSDLAGLSARMRETARLPREGALQDSARARAEAAQNLSSGVDALRAHAAQADLRRPRVADDAAKVILEDATRLHAAAGALRALGHDVSGLEEGLADLEALVAGKSGRPWLLAFAPSTGALGAPLPVRAFLLGAEEAQARVSLGGRPAVTATLRGGAGSVVEVPVPLDASLLGAREVTVEADLPQGGTLSARAQTVLARHPTRILVGTLDPPRVASALDPAPPEVQVLLRAGPPLLLVEDGSERPFDPARFDPTREAAFRFPGSSVLAPSTARHAPIMAVPTPGDDALLDPRHLLLLAGALALVALAAGAWVLLRRARKPAAADAGTPAVVAPARRERPTLPSFAEGGEPAATVVHAYASARAQTLGSGLGTPTQTPREWACEASDRLGIAEPRVLVEVYERVRFSREPAADDDARRALAAALRVVEAVG